MELDGNVCIVINTVYEQSTLLTSKGEFGAWKDSYFKFCTLLQEQTLKFPKIII